MCIQHIVVNGMAVSMEIERMTAQSKPGLNRNIHVKYALGHGKNT